MPALPYLETPRMSMSSSGLMRTETASDAPAKLIYRLEDRPPLPQTLFAAGQHLLAMFVAVITQRC